MTEPSDYPDRVRVVTSALALHDPLPEPPGLAPEPPPVGAVLHPPSPTDPGLRTWFLLQVWSEVQLAFRMHFDSRYRISRTSQFLGPVILGLFVLNYFVFSVWFSFYIVSPIAERIDGPARVAARIVHAKARIGEVERAEAIEAGIIEDTLGRIHVVLAFADEPKLSERRRDRKERGPRRPRTRPNARRRNLRIHDRAVPLAALAALARRPSADHGWR